MKSSDIPKGFTCKCGKEVQYPAYVYAHWREPLVYTCESCGQKWEIVTGHAREVKA